MYLTYENTVFETKRRERGKELTKTKHKYQAAEMVSILWENQAISINSLFSNIKSDWELKMPKIMNSNKIVKVREIKAIY